MLGLALNVCHFHLRWFLKDFDFLHNLFKGFWVRKKFMKLRVCWVAQLLGPAILGLAVFNRTRNNYMLESRASFVFVGFLAISIVLWKWTEGSCNVGRYCYCNGLRYSLNKNVTRADCGWSGKVLDFPKLKPSYAACVPLYHCLVRDLGEACEGYVIAISRIKPRTFPLQLKKLASLEFPNIYNKIEKYI